MMFFFSSENLAMHKKASQKHPYFPLSASRAMDGRNSINSSSRWHCAASYGHPTAEWRVDLEEICSIQHVILHYNTNNLAWGTNLFFYSKFSLQGNPDKRIEHKWYPRSSIEILHRHDLYFEHVVSPDW